MVQSAIVDEADIMVHNGTTWVGYLDSDPIMRQVLVIKLIPMVPIVSATEPAATNGQSDKTALKNGDIWINTANLDKYPEIYRWSNAKSAWVQLDLRFKLHDGVLFADARYSTAGANADAATIKTC